MSKKTEALADLNTRLVTIQTTIKTINEQGQAFKKGGVSGFAVDMAQLPTLLREEKQLKNEISIWGLYE